MFVDPWLRSLNPQGKRALVFAAGGGADVLLAQFVGKRLQSEGALSVDLAQPLNRDRIDTDTQRRFRLQPLERELSDQVMMFASVVANDEAADGKRGKGISIAAAIEWESGENLVFAARGEGVSLLARRAWCTNAPYEIAVAVDGGGDILTDGPDTFDRIVFDRFRQACDNTTHVALLVVGLGADGASSEEAFELAKVEDLQLAEEAQIDVQSCELIETTLLGANRLHLNPERWRTSDPHWSRGLHVPQIIQLAVQNRLPASERGVPYVLAPRPTKKADVPVEPNPATGEKWLVLNQQLLTRARWYRPSC